MRLELHLFHIQNVLFGKKTTLDDRVLFIDKGELRKFLLEDKRFGEVEIELAHPGESCRIIRVSDVIEPRAKISGGQDFPGALNKQGGAGEGSTCVLCGTAVVLSDFTEEGRFGRDRNGELIDMSGTGAELSIYGKTHNVVVLPYPAEGITPDDYRVALKLAGLKTATYLASTAKALSPDSLEVYELPCLPDVGKGLETLPKVAYIFQLLSTQHGAVPDEPVLYGRNITEMLPIILHPNELLDGAVTSPYRAYCGQTYLIQNNAIIKELYRKHGKELCFAGVIATTAHHTEAEFERTASMAANLAKWIIKADGVILTKTGGGAPEQLLGRTAQRCEELGVKTALAFLHMSADPIYTKFEYSINFNLPLVDAIVSMGSPNMLTSLSPVKKVIGKPVEAPEGPRIGAEIKKQIMWIKGASSQFGDSRLILTPY